MDEFLALLRAHSHRCAGRCAFRAVLALCAAFQPPGVKEAMREAGLRYLYLGKELGGSPDDLSFYDADGRADYRMISETDDVS